MKMNLLIKAVLVAGISTAGAIVFADDYNNSMGNEPLSSQQFVKKASMANLKEIHLAQAALQKTQNKGIQRFARRMIRDHSKANDKLVKIAQDENLSVPPTNYFDIADANNSQNAYYYNTNTPPMKQATALTMPASTETNSALPAIQYLEALPKPAFDRAYVGAMVKDHEKAVALFENASQNVQDAKLQKFAKKTLPTLREHYRMAQDLADKIGVNGGSMEWNSSTNSM